jgi:hypothetical protein
LFCNALGAFGLASPLPFKDLLDTSSPDKEQREEDGWVGCLWKHGSYGQPFFDQVAELESILPKHDESNSIKNPGSFFSSNSSSEKEIPQEVPTFISNLKESAWSLPESLFGHYEELQVPSFMTSSPDMTESPDDDDIESLDSATSDKVTGIESLDPFGTLNHDVRTTMQGSDTSSPMGTPVKALDKRSRNNQASKKFRKVRKGKHRALLDKAQELENENYELKVQFEKLVEEINHFKAILPEDIKLMI